MLRCVVILLHFNYQIAFDIFHLAGDEPVQRLVSDVDATGQLLAGAVQRLSVLQPEHRRHRARRGPGAKPHAQALVPIVDAL